MCYTNVDGNLYNIHKSFADTKKI